MNDYYIRQSAANITFCNSFHEKVTHEPLKADLHISFFFSSSMHVVVVKIYTLLDHSRKLIEEQHLPT